MKRLLVAALVLEGAYRAVVRAKNRKFVRLLSLVADRLEAGGLEYWLDWGTLLGAVREGGILEHDTDTDLTLPESQGPALRELALREFASRGYRVQDRGTSLLIGLPVHPTRHGLDDEIMVHLELAPEADGTIVLNAGRRPVSVGLVRPLARVRLAGRWWPAPGRTQEYLEAIYGYTGRVCVYLGNDRYRPAATFGEVASYHWNRLVFYRGYFLVKALPLPRAWKEAGSSVTRSLERWLGAPKI